MRSRSTLALLAAFAAGATFAQRAAMPYALQHAHTEMNDNRIEAPASDGSRAIIFQEDFANGLQGNNGFGEWTATGPNAAVWRWSTNGPVGAFSNPAQQRIGSATVGNGFMILNGDSANTNFSATPPVLASNIVEWDASIESPVLDLTGNEDVELVFTHRFRWCCQQASPHTVELSTDGGASWIKVFNVQGLFETNEDNGTRTVRLNLYPFIQGNAGQVRFRFHHNPTASHYSWQIDDVILQHLPSNDLMAESAFLTQTGTGEEYGRMPYSQLGSTILVGAVVINQGKFDQNNVAVDMVVRNSAGVEVINTTIAGGTMMSGDTLTVETDLNVPAQLPDNVYTATFTVRSDSTDNVPANNAFLRAFEISEDRYSCDGIGNHPPGYQRLDFISTEDFDNSDDNFHILTYYEVDEPLTVYGMEIQLAQGTAAGGYVFGALLDTVDVFANPINLTSPLVESAAVDITQPIVSAGSVRIPFPAPYILQPNAYYADIILNSIQGASRIRILDDKTVPQPFAMSMIYIPIGPQSGFYSNGIAAAVRLVTEPLNVSVREIASDGNMQVFPNPSTGEVNVTTDMSGTVQLEVINALGEVVHEQRFNGSIGLDLSTLAKGVYSVRLTNAGVIRTERLTLN
jgi:hypothetical protein